MKLSYDDDYDFWSAYEQGLQLQRIEKEAAEQEKEAEKERNDQLDDYAKMIDHLVKGRGDHRRQLSVKHKKPYVRKQQRH